MTESHPFIDHNAALPVSFPQQADQIEAWIDGKPLIVKRYSQLDFPVYMTHASILDEEEHELRFAIKRKYRGINLYPKTLGIDFEYKDGEGKNPAPIIRFKGNPYLVIECEAIGYFCLCFDPQQKVPAGDSVLNAIDVGLVSDPAKVQSDVIQAAIDRVSESKELDTLLLPAGYYRSGDLRLRSNCNIHLASGAILRASDNADDMGDPSLRGAHPDRANFVQADNVENVAITGHGHIDGNRCTLDVQRYYKSMLVYRDCKNISIDGPVFSDSCGWNTTLRRCESAHVKRLKIFNNRPFLKCLNTDGVNPDGCQTVTIEQCIFHTGDDAVAVKSSKIGEERAGDCCDITVRDLIAINNSSTAKVGTETMGAKMERIHFERITAVRTVRLAVIDAYDRAAIRDVRWTDCHVHHLADQAGINRSFVVDLHALPVGFAFRPIAAKATDRNIRLERVTSDSGGMARLCTRFDDGVPAIDGIIVKDLTIAGKPAELTHEEPVPRKQIAN